LRRSRAPLIQRRRLVRCSVFHAQAVGQRTSTVTITSNGGSPTVALTGTAGNPFSVAPSGPTTATVGPGQPATCGVGFTPSTNLLRHCDVYLYGGASRACLHRHTRDGGSHGVELCLSHLAPRGCWRFWALRSWPGSRHQQTRTRTIVIAIVAICSIAAWGGSSTSTIQPPNYTVTFTATTGSTKRTINFALTVN
jgi:hypothetical protein